MSNSLTKVIIIVGLILFVVSLIIFLMRSGNNINFFSDPTGYKMIDEEQFYTYDCTKAYIRSQSGWGSYTAGGGCQNGYVTMEMRDHHADLRNAYENCRSRGLRLPTSHEMSSAAKNSSKLNLSAGNYWIADVKHGYEYEQNCFMPIGNCGTHSPHEIQSYRCVIPDESSQPNE